MKILDKYKLLVTILGMTNGVDYKSITMKNYESLCKSDKSIVRESDITKENLKLANKMWGDLLTLYGTNDLHKYIPNADPHTVSVIIKLINKIIKSESTT